jgi:hypothetical protein
MSSGCMFRNNNAHMQIVYIIFFWTDSLFLLSIVDVYFSKRTGLLILIDIVHMYTFSKCYSYWPICLGYVLCKILPFTYIDTGWSFCHTFWCLGGGRVKWIIFFLTVRTIRKFLRQSTLKRKTMYIIRGIACLVPRLLLSTRGPNCIHSISTYLLPRLFPCSSAGQNSPSSCSNFPPMAAPWRLS